MKRVILPLAMVFLALFSLGAAAQMSSPVTMPVYGNWCGPGHPENPMSAGPPIDQLDSACFRHDMCTAARGILNCGCDIGFLSELRNTRWANPLIAYRARAVYDAMAMTPCSDPAGTVTKQRMFLTDWIGGVLSGQESPEAVMNRLRDLGMNTVDRSLFDGFWR